MCVIGIRSNFGIRGCFVGRYDSTHVAVTDWYREFVFGSAEKLVTKGHFIEAELGQAPSPPKPC